MESAAWALQQSIYQHLAADSAVTQLLGGPEIYDDVPRSAEFPYLTFGASQIRDWSTASDDSDEHIVTMHIWSRANGRKETFEVMNAVRDALNGANLTLTDHRLVNLRFEFSDARREPDGETYHGVVRYRAVTEPL